MIKLPNSRSIEQVLNKVQSEYIVSKRYMDPIKRKIAENRKIYIDPKRDDEEKLRINLAFSNIRTLMALSVTDELSISYIGKTTSDFKKAANWNKLAQDFFRSVLMTLVNIESKEDRFVAGVSIRCLDRDGDDIMAYAVDPLCWLPDPRGAFHTERFRWHAFKEFKTKQWMEDMGFKGIENFVTLKGQDLWDWDNLTEYGDKRAESMDLKINEYAVLKHIGTYDGKKYIVYTNSEITELAYMQPITDYMPSLDTLVLGMKGDLYPLTLSYRCPSRGRPEGISVIDLEWDKQVNLSKLANLAMQRAMRVSLGGHKFFNINKIKNQNEIKNLSTKPKVIGVDLKQGEGFGDIIYEQPISIQQPQENYNAQENIQYWAKKAIALDDNSQGVVNSNGQTATETVAAQAAANLLASFGNLLDYLADAELALKWQLMKSKSITRKQVVTVLNPLGEKAMEFTKSDLKLESIVNVVIKSRTDQEKNDDIQTNKMLQILPFVQEQGGFPYKKFVRDVIEKVLRDPECAEMYIPLLPEEDEAREQIQLLNDNIDLAEVDNIDGEDHLAYIAWYSMANDTPAKMKAIDARREAQKQRDMNKKMREEAQEQAGAMGGQPGGGNQALQNQSMASITANNMSQKPQAPSIVDAAK